MFCIYLSYLGTADPLNRKLLQLSAARSDTYLEVWQGAGRGENYFWCWEEGETHRRNDPF